MNEIKTESEIALWLVENNKKNPLTFTKIEWVMGDWYVTGSVPVIGGWGTLEISFRIDSCQDFLGLSPVHDVDVVFTRDKKIPVFVVGKMSGIIEKSIKPFKDFLESVPRRK